MMFKQGSKHPNWKGGVAFDKVYQNIMRLNRRHRLGISKRYIYDGKKIGISYAPEYKKEYRIKNKERIRLHRKRYKYLKVNAGKLNIATIQQVYEDNIKKYGTLTCYLCEQPILFGQDNLEHKTPLSRGGTNARENLDIAHQKCNNKKFNKTEIEYRKDMQDG